MAGGAAGAAAGGASGAGRGVGKGEPSGDVGEPGASCAIKAGLARDGIAASDVRANAMMRAAAGNLSYRTCRMMERF